MRRYCAVVIIIGILLVASTADAAPLESFVQQISINGKTFFAKGIRVELGKPSITVKVGLAQGYVVRTEGLAAIAKRYHAVAAINGSFFAAYSKDPLKNPDMSLITNGRLTFKSDIGSLLGFTAQQVPYLGCPRYRLQGNLRHRNGRQESWFAYWLNRNPTSSPCVTIFTPAWGEKVEAMSGTSVVVKDGHVTAITADGAAIPPGGYVIHFRGEKSLLRRFQVGDEVTFTPQTRTGDDDAGNWAEIREAVGAGPRVLHKGKPVFDPRSEGFSDPKILERAGTRSAVGFTADHVLYLITTTNARVCDLGSILKALGCVEGMNLDGGASSGLWYRGNYLTTPGRDISNALLILEK
ncbi:MAG: phosphodiester glycosidase family protein [Armatimonadota bacterium]